MIDIIQIIKLNRKKWIHPDTDYKIYIRTIYNLIKHLESLPLRKYTIKQNYKCIKFTKKQISI